MSQVGSWGRRVSAVSAAVLAVGLAAAPAASASPGAPRSGVSEAIAPVSTSTAPAELGTRAAASAPAKPRIRLASVGRSVKVDIDPNLSGSRSWSFSLWRSATGNRGSFVKVGTYRTLGSHERMSVQVRGGWVKVVVPAQHRRAAGSALLRHYADVTPGSATVAAPGSITLGLPAESRGLVVLSGRARDALSGIGRVEVWRGTTRLGLASISPQPPSRTRSVAWEWRGLVPGSWRGLKVRTVDRSGNRSAFVVASLAVAPPSSTRWTQVDRSCGITVAGAAYCWGLNSYGQLGRGGTTYSAVPVPVQGLGSGVRSISSSGIQACAVTDANEVWCWGRGPLGDGGTSGSSVPVKVSGLPAVAEVSVGHLHICAVTVAGAAYCWGENPWGGLGNGTTTTSTVPVAVTGLGDGTTAQVRVGGERSCALTTAGAVRCWGGEWNEDPGSQLSAIWPTSSVPVTVPGLSSGVAQLRLDGGFACVITTAGKGRCWGTNASGDEYLFPSPRPATPPFLPAIFEPLVDIATESGIEPRTCGVTASGAMTCWQWDIALGRYDELYLPVTPDPARPVAGLRAGVADVSPGCVVTTSGAAYCWPVVDLPVWTDRGSSTVLDLEAVPDPA